MAERDLQDPAGTSPSPDGGITGPRSSTVEKATADDDLPVVARLIVEIRSDGSRTIARGAMEEMASGQRVAVEARGDSPLALALALARSLASLPKLTARAAVRGLLDRRSKK